MTEKISVIVPVYKVEPYINKCIESILNQSYQNLQVILVDDGSTDRCGEICDEFARKDDRVHVIHQSNTGQAEARNVGLDIAEGDFISFVDSDDSLDKDFYETLYQGIISHNADIVSCGVKYIYNGRTESNSSNLVLVNNSKEAMSLLLQQKYVRFEVWNKLYKRSVVNGVRFKRGQIHEEVFFTSQVLFKSNCIVYIDKPLYNYLLERQGNTNSTFGENRLDIFKEFDLLTDQLKAHEMQELIPDLYVLALEFAISFYKLATTSAENSKLIKSKIFKIFSDIYIKTKRSHTILPVYMRSKIALFKIAPDVYMSLVSLRNPYK